MAVCTELAPERARRSARSAPCRCPATRRAMPASSSNRTATRCSSGRCRAHGDYQFARPDWGIAFDVDSKLAAETRKRTLDRVAADGMLIAGMHLPFPGFGHVARDGQAYRFVPAEWVYEL